MAGSGRQQGGGFSSQAPHPPSAPPCDVVASCGHHSPHVLQNLTGRTGKAGETTSVDFRLSTVFFPDFSLSSFL